MFVVKNTLVFLCLANSAFVVKIAVSFVIRFPKHRSPRKPLPVPYVFCFDRSSRFRKRQPCRVLLIFCVKQSLEFNLSFIVTNIDNFLILGTRHVWLRHAFLPYVLHGRIWGGGAGSPRWKIDLAYSKIKIFICRPPPPRGGGGGGKEIF